MLNDQLANVLSTLLNAERISKRECLVKGSGLIKRVLTLLNETGYLGNFTAVETSKGEYLTIQLIGTINKTGAIKPRSSVTVGNYEKYEKRFLPAKDFGILIISTSKGLLTHKDAKAKNLGGRLIAYCY